jgi:hypothetical protein
VEFIGKNNGNQRLKCLCIPPEDRWNKKTIEQMEGIFKKIKNTKDIPTLMGYYTKKWETFF